MITNAVKGKGFRGVLEYALNKEKGFILNSNMFGNNPKNLAKEFGVIRKNRPNLAKVVLHVSLSAAPGDELTDEQWEEIGDKYLLEMGFVDNQFVLIKHTDTDHDHVHLIINRVNYRGEVVSDSQDYQRQEIIMRKIEQDYGLRRVAPSREAERRALTKGEIECAIRTGQPSARHQLQQRCDIAAGDCNSFTEYQKRLEAVGVELVPVVQLEGAKLSGLSYRLDGVIMKGSDLGKSYTPAGLAKRGINYDQIRDGAAVSHSIKREVNRAFGERSGDNKTGQTSERGGVIRSDVATSQSNGLADGRYSEDASRYTDGASRNTNSTRRGSTDDRGYRPQEQGGKGNVQQSDKHSHKKSQSDGLEASQSNLSSDDNYSSSRECLLALGGPSDCTKRTGRGSGSKIPQTRPDRSLNAIEKQITAFGIERFEVGLRDAETGQMMPRYWNRAELIDAVPWLKRMNAKGNDIYIRPAGEHGLVLVDDLKPAALDQMKQDGYQPAAAIETSPDNYQVWVKLSEQAQPPEVRQAIAKELAEKYKGDLNSTDAKHYGRLAGFTNQKPQHAHDGQQPYVLAHDCSGAVAVGAARHLESVKQRLDAVDVREAGLETERRLEAIKTALSVPESSGFDAKKVYRYHAKLILPKYANPDFSRLDWMITKTMLKNGRFSLADIGMAIRECSPCLEVRKTGHVEDYIQRTIRNAKANLNNPDESLEPELGPQAQRSGPETGPSF